MEERIEITAEWLGELEAKALAATPGPWEYNDEFVLVRLPDDEELRALAKQRQSNNVINVNRAYGREACNANAAYIASVNPDAVLALIAEVRRLENCAQFRKDFLELAKLRGYDAAVAAMKAGKI